MTSDVSYIEFKPHHVLNGSEYMKASIQSNKLLEILSKNKNKEQ